MAISELPNEFPNEASRTAVSFDGVRIAVSTSSLEVELSNPAPGFSPFRVDPLWHEAAVRPALHVVLTSNAEDPRRVRLRNATSDARFRPEWASWRVDWPEARESQGGLSARRQEAVRAGGELTLLLQKGEAREAWLEFEIPLADGLSAGRIPFRLQASTDEGDAEELRVDLTLRHPSSDLLEKLPGTYQEAMEKFREELGHPETPFFERYLVGFQDAIDPLRDALCRLDALFGPYTAPPDMLVWLATWVCMDLDENWPEIKRRQLVKAAVQLFRWRGTRWGLSRFLEIYTGVVPEIHDRPQPGVSIAPELSHDESGSRRAVMGAPGTIIGDIPDHTFVVTLVVPDPKQIDESVVHRIIAAEKPAHTAYRLHIVRGEPRPTEANDPPEPLDPCHSLD